MIDVGGQAGLKYVPRPFDIDRVQELPSVVRSWRHDRREMNHAIDLLFSEQVGDRLVPDIHLYLANASRDVVTVDINGHHMIGVFLRQACHDLAADEAAAAGDQGADCHTSAAAAVGIGAGRRDHHVDTVNPLRRCHTPHQAATMAMPPRPSKNPKINTSASAEF